MINLKECIKKLPEPIKKPIYYAYSAVPVKVKYNRHFWETRALIEESQWWSEGELYQYQCKELSKLLNHCYNNVPYYKDLFNAVEFNPFNLQDPRDIEKIPFLTKEIIRQNFGALKSTNFSDKDFISSNTGGSSGIPLSFYVQRGYSDMRESAFFDELWSRVGFKFDKDQRMVLRGSIVNNKSGYEYRPGGKEWVCSTYFNDEEHFANYLCLLKDKKIKFIHGHVSSVCLFAQYLIEKNEQYPLKAVFGGSEIVYPFQRELIKKAFDTRLFSWYGHSEIAALAGECEYSSDYHIYPQYGLFELIDKEGNVITRPGELGEIVATGFNNYAMPFIRYKTGDMAEYKEGYCENCGRKYKILAQVQGRTYEYVINSEGNKISLTGLVFGQHFEAFTHIKKMQLHQREAGKIRIKIVPGQGYSSINEVEITQKISAASNGKVEVVSFDYVDDIPLTEGGKHKFLIREIE